MERLFSPIRNETEDSKLNCGEANTGVSTLEKCGADGTTTPEVEASENCGAPTSEIKVLETCGAATPDCGEGSGGTTTGDCGEKRTSGDPEKETVVTLGSCGDSEEDREGSGIPRNPSF